MSESTTKTKALVITRLFDAQLALVWKAWTEPEHLMKWWGPKNFTSPVCKMDFRVGGTYHWCMQSPEGQKFWTTGEFREIVPLERIVYSDSFADEKGNAVPASYYGMAGEWEMVGVVTVTFKEVNGKTTMTLTHVGLPSAEMEEMTSAGWNESFDKLAASLK